MQGPFASRRGAAFPGDVAIDALACLLPPLILPPLVENAVKHGIGNLTEGGAVRIHAARAGSQLRLNVENDVDAAQPTASRSGNRFRGELTIPFETKGETKGASACGSFSSPPSSSTP